MFGYPNVDFYATVDTVAQFDTIKKWLLKNQKKHVENEHISGKQLSHLVVKLLEFQEDQFGVNAVKRSQFTRIPMECFLDFRSGGALCVILTEVYQFKAEMGWKRFDLGCSSRLVKHLELFKRIVGSLRENNCLTFPTCFLRPEIPASQVIRLREIILKHNGVVADGEEDADHVVFPSCLLAVNKNQEELAPESTCDDSNPKGKRWVRCVQRKTDSVLVHFWFRPDSYDAWITTKEPVDELMTDDNCGIWLVTADWILDTDKYNEWMNEEDYEIIEDDFLRTGQSRYKVMAENRPTLNMSMCDVIAKGAANDGNVSATSSHQNSSDPLRLDSIAEDKKTKTSTKCSDSVKNSWNIDESTMDSTRGSYTTDSKDLQKLINFADQMRFPSNVDENTMDMDFKVDSTTLKSELPPRFSEQTHHVVVPSYAAWFDYNAANAIERQSLPEFFNDDADADSSAGLVTSCRSKKTPELYMNLRNFMIDTYRVCPGEYLTITACRRSIAGDVCSLMRVHGFLEQWGLINYQVDPDWKPAALGPPCSSHFSVLADTPAGLAPINYPKESQSVEQQQQQRENGIEEGATCDADETITETSTKRKPITGGIKAKEWTDEEMLALLDGIDIYTDDWNAIADHVGSRSQHECILKFIQLPIEDPFLDAVDNVGPLRYHPIPFSQNTNPIMTTVAFLASAVDPRIAAAASKAALNEFALLRNENVASAGKEKLKMDSDVEMRHFEDNRAVQKTEQVAAEDADMEDADHSQSKNEMNLEIDSKADFQSISTVNVAGKTEPVKSGDDVEISGDKSAAQAEQQLKVAASAALAAAAVKSKHLAEIENQKIKAVVSELVELQMTKLDLKLRQFEELENMLDRERDMLEESRLQLLMERQQFQEEQLKCEEVKQRNIAAHRLLMNDSRMTANGPQQQMISQSSYVTTGQQLVGDTSQQMHPMGSFTGQQLVGDTSQQMHPMGSSTGQQLVGDTSQQMHPMGSSTRQQLVGDTSQQMHPMGSSTGQQLVGDTSQQMHPIGSSTGQQIVGDTSQQMHPMGSSTRQQLAGDTSQQMHPIGSSARQQLAGDTSQQMHPIGSSTGQQLAGDTSQQMHSNDDIQNEMTGSQTRMQQSATIMDSVPVLQQQQPVEQIPTDAMSHDMPTALNCNQQAATQFHRHQQPSLLHHRVPLFAAATVSSSSAASSAFTATTITTTTTTTAAAASSSGGFSPNATGASASTNIDVTEQPANVAAVDDVADCMVADEDVHMMDCDTTAEQSKLEQQAAVDPLQANQSNQPTCCGDDPQPRVNVDGLEGMQVQAPVTQYYPGSSNLVDTEMGCPAADQPAAMSSRPTPDASHVAQQQVDGKH